MKGSLQEKNNKYYAVFRINGKQKWVGLNIPTTKGNKRKAEQALQDLLASYEDNEKNSSDILFIDYLTLWLKEEQGVIKPSTYETYEITVNRKIIPYFERYNYKLYELNASCFTEFFKYLKLNGRNNGKGLSEKSVKNIRGILSSVFDTAYKNHLISENPVQNSKMPVFEKNIKKEVETYSADEVKRLLAVAKASESHIYLFLLLAVFTGLRRGELLALTWDNIDFENKTLTVNKNRTGACRAVTKQMNTPKTNSSNRTIPLTDNIIDALRTEQKKQAENKVLFGNCYSEIDNCIIRNKDGRPYSNLSCINRVVNRLMEKAQLKHCTIHGLRHTVASLLDDNGVPIQEISTLLGHKNVSTTEKIYIHRKSTAKAENIMLLNNLYGN